MEREREKERRRRHPRQPWRSGGGEAGTWWRGAPAALCGLPESEGFGGRGRREANENWAEMAKSPKTPRATAKPAPNRQGPRPSPWPLSSPRGAACSALAAAEYSSPCPALAPLPPRLAATARRSDRRRACSPRCGRWATRARSLCRRSNCGRRGPETASEPLSSNASSGSSASATATARPSR